MNLSNVTSFASLHKKEFALAGVGLALLLIGYGSGRYVQPAKIVEKERIVTQVQEKIVYKDKIIERKVYVIVEKKDEHVETTTTKLPDGTVTTKTTKDTHVDDTKKSDTTKTDDKTVEKDKVVVQVVEKLKLVESKPLDWRIGVGVGVSIPYYLGQGSVGVPGLQGAVIEVGIDKRIVGPAWLGINGNTQGTVGLNLSVVF